MKKIEYISGRTCKIIHFEKEDYIYSYSALIGVADVKNKKLYLTDPDTYWNSHTTKTHVRKMKQHYLRFKIIQDKFVK